MGDLVNNLGNKAAGQLIRSQDWNALVEALERTRDDLTARIDDLDRRTDDRITALETELGRVSEVIRTVVEPYLADVFRVTLETERTNFALGELAEITARLTDSAGQPMDLSNPATRPWVDFVAPWGRLRAAPGFTTLDDAASDGDRSISVQVNAQGLAKVRLSADHAEGLGEDVDNGIAAHLKDRARPELKAAAQTFLEAATPADAAARESFKMLSIAYDREDATTMRSYADSYFIRNTARVTGAITADFVDRWRHSWRDYRAIILAFAKRDADPRTPDQARGSASIQITFRDWIGPWIITDYLPSFTELVPNLKDRFRLKVKPDFTDSVIGFREEIDASLLGKGAIGKLRSYNGIREAVARLDPANMPSFLPDLAQTISGAVSLQQSLEAAQSATAGAVPQAHAYSVMLTDTARADRKTAEIDAKVGSVNAQVRAQVADAVRSEVQSITGPEGVVGGLESKVREIDNRVKTFNTVVGDAANLQGRLQKVADLDSDLKIVRDRVARLGG